MDDRDGEQQGGKAHKEMSPDVEMTTPPREETGRQTGAELDLGGNNHNDIDNVNRGVNDKHPRIGEQPGSTLLGPVDTRANRSPIAPPDKSWPVIDTQASYHSDKRDGSPFDTVSHPNKRVRNDNFPGLVRASIPLAHSPVLQELEGPHEATQGHNRYTPNGLGTSHQLGFQSPIENEMDVYEGYSSLAHPHSSHVGDSGQYTTYVANQKSPYQNHQAHVRIPGLKLVRDTHAANPPMQIPGLKNFQNAQNAKDSVQIPAQTLIQNAQKVALEGRPSQTEPERTPLETSRNTKKSRPPKLGSAIWAEGTPVQRQQSRADQDHTQEHEMQVQQHRTENGPNPRRTHQGAKNTAPLAREYPFWDGGVPGEGGESSDDEMLMNPVVVGRAVHEGGWRNNPDAAPLVGKTQDVGRFQLLQKAFTQEDMWKGAALRSRRKLKLYSRELAKAWEETQARGDEREMMKIERAAIAYKDGVFTIPRRNAVGELDYEGVIPESPQYTTPPPRRVSQPSFHAAFSRSHTQYTGRSSLEYVGFSQAGSQSHKTSKPLLSDSSENRAKTQSAYASTPRTGDFRNQVGLPSAYANGYLFSDDADDEDYENDESEEEDATPIEQLCRKNRQYSCATNVESAAYRAAKALEKAPTIPFNDRSAQAQATNNRAQSPRPRNTPSKSCLLRTPPPKIEPRESPLVQRAGKSPVFINLISSAENTPVAKRSLPMKERITPAKKKSVARLTKIRNQARQKAQEAEEDPVNPEFARQQMCAERIITAEFKASSEQIDEEIFGATVGPTEEEMARERAAKLDKVNQKRQARRKEQLAQDEKARLTGAQKKKELEEAREKARAEKERDEKSKKAKREAERKKQSTFEAEILEEKRQNALQRIAASRSQQVTEAKSQEKKKLKDLSMEMHQLKVQLMKQNLEMKKLQAASLTPAKADTLDNSNHSAAKATPSPIAEDDDDSLFISEAHSNKRVIPTNMPALLTNAQAKTFREEVAEDRAAFEESQRYENIKRQLLSRSLSTTPTSSTKTAKHLEEIPKSPHLAPKNKFVFENLHNTLNTMYQPPIVGNPIESLPVKTKKTKPVSKRSTQAIVTQPHPPPRKTYNSQVRLVADVERERLRNEQKTREDEKKRKKNLDRWLKDSVKKEQQYRKKLEDEANAGGFTRTEGQLKTLVDDYMKKREKRQARTAIDPSSFNSNFALQVKVQSFDRDQPFTHPQSPSQPQPQQLPSSFSTIFSDTEPEELQTDTQVNQSPKTKQGDLDSWLGPSKRERGSRFAEAAAKSSVSHFQQDVDESEESEEDPDETLEALYRQKQGNKVAVNAVEGENQAGESDPNDYETELEADLNDVIVTELATQAQPQSSNPQPTRNSVNKGVDATSENPSQEKGEMVHIYYLEKTTTTEGEESDAERLIMLTDRQEANEVGKELIEECRKNATVKPYHFRDGCGEDNLYTGTVVFDMSNSVTVKVVCNMGNTSNLAGLDVSTMKKLHGERVWVIKRDLKKSSTDDENRIIITHLKEDATNEVYTDREFANHEAAKNFIKFLKPKECEHEEQWTEWQNTIWDELKKCDDKNECFGIGVIRVDGHLGWMEWDDIDYKVEEKKTSGPKN